MPPSTIADNIGFESAARDASPPPSSPGIGVIIVAVVVGMLRLLLLLLMQMLQARPSSACVEYCTVQRRRAERRIGFYCAEFDGNCATRVRDHPRRTNGCFHYALSS
jgi:hypothetical protein